MKRRRVEWSARARADLLEIGDHIAADDPVAAQRWVLKLAAAAARMTRVPTASRRVPEIGRDDVREVRLGSYRIVFRILPRSIQVLTIFEGHRRFPRALLD